MSEICLISFQHSWIPGAFGMGVVHIDTSSAHARGKNERIIGSIVKNMPRDSFIISTSTGVDIYKDRKTELIREDANQGDILKSFEGRVKFIGVTTHQNEPNVIKAVAESQVYDVVATAYNFRQMHRQEVKEP